MGYNSRADKRIVAFHDAFDSGIEYCRPHWEQYGRLYKLWRTKKPDELEGTFSKINIPLFHATVQDRLPKLSENIFSTQDFISVLADTPEAEFSRKAAEMWLKETLVDGIKIHSTIIPTLQTTLIGGTAYRMPYVMYGKDGNPTVTSKDVDFFSVIPAPGGGHVNPHDKHQQNAVPWVMVVDWWTEGRLRDLAEKGILNKAEVRKMLDRKPEDRYDEDTYKDAFATVGNLQYTTDQAWRKRTEHIEDGGANNAGKKRRIVHWFRRDRHLIIGEDYCVLYESDENSGYDGTIPIAKYVTCPDQNNWFGISYLQIQEDLLRAMVMNVNYRMDNLIGTMFPREWIRKDIADAMGYTEADFIPRPYDTKFYPGNLKGERIRDIIFTDRREEVSPQSFMDEDRMKAMIQKIAGQTETTSSLGDVIGNKTATGVTSILSEMSGRPNMESTILEWMGLREECILLLALGRKHIVNPTVVRQKNAKDGFNWTMLEPEDLNQQFTVMTHGTRYLSEKRESFQKLLAMYPFWNQSPVWDQYELNRQAAMIADVLPDPDAALMQPQMMADPMMQGASMPGQPGGAASGQDINHQINSVRNRTAPEAGTGRTTRANP